MSTGRSSAMSRHEGVSCDACMKSNFSSLRFKCLVCYDYDLCASCRDSGATSSRHTVNHPMQCIMTRADLNMYYGGDSSSTLQTLSYTCSYCGQMGFSIVLLLEHIRSSHGGNSGASATEVVCPVCAVLPSGDPNHVTDDLAAHIALVHRLTPTDFEEDQLTSIRHIRRLTHPTRTANLGLSSSANNASGTAGGGGGGGNPGVSRANRGAAIMQLIELPSLPGAGLSAASRDPMDPIAELLSQLSSVRSRALGGPHSLSSHFSQLEMQLASSRQHLERLSTRQQEPSTKTPSSGNANPASQAVSAESQSSAANKTSTSGGASNSSAASLGGRSRFLLNRTTEKNATETERESREADWADRSLFVQELLLALMSESSDVIQPGIFSEQECWSSVDDLQLSDSDGLLSKLAHSPSASSQHDSTSSLAGVYNDADSAAVAVPRAAENCEPIGKDSFSVDVSNCGAVGGLEVACTRAGVL